MASVGGSAPEPPGRIKFSIILIFLSNSVQKIHAIFANFTLPISTNFLTFFYLRAPHYSMSILDYLFLPELKFYGPRKLKNFLKNLQFFSNVLNIFQFFINFNAYFWKITSNFRALSNSKNSFHPRKIGPAPNILWTPLNRKILHKLLRRSLRKLLISVLNSYF